MAIGTTELDEGEDCVGLGLCTSCAALSQRVDQNGYRQAGETWWIRLPVFCAICEAKVAQAVRLLVAGYVLVKRTG